MGQDSRPVLSRWVVTLVTRAGGTRCSEDGCGGHREARAGLRYPFTFLSPTALQAPTCGGRGHRPSGQRAPASSAAGSATTCGFKAQKSWIVPEGSALSLPGPALQGRIPSPPLSTPFLLAKHLETPGRRLLGSGTPYLTGTQEPRQGGQEQQLGRRRRRRHPGPPRAGRPAAQPTRERSPPGPAPAHPRRPRAHVDPGLAPAGPARPQTARLDSRARAPPASPRPRRSEERRVGKECRSRWSPYH